MRARIGAYLLCALLLMAAILLLNWTPSFAELMLSCAWPLFLYGWKVFSVSPFGVYALIPVTIFVYALLALSPVLVWAITAKRVWLLLQVAGFLVIAVLFVTCGETLLTTDRPEGQQADSEEAKSDMVLASPNPMVDALVSSNSSTIGLWDEQLPSSWSEAEDRRVRKAYRDIVAKGKPVVPILLANLDREEFSTYVPSAVPYSPCNVGRMCEMAISDMFDPIDTMYKSRKNRWGMNLMGYSYFAVAFYPTRKAPQWWALHQHKTTEEIRSMIRDWYIQREVSFGFENAEQKKSIIERIEKGFSGEWGVRRVE